MGLFLTLLYLRRDAYLTGMSLLCNISNANKVQLTNKFYHNQTPTYITEYLKTIILTTIILLSTVLLSAQASSLETSTFGLQIGVFGAWAYYETKVSDPVALRLEVGTQGWSVEYCDQYRSNDIAVFVSPEITIEPRFYYNLGKRNERNKSLAKNSGNFLSLRASYRPDLLIASNNDTVGVNSNISFISK